MVLQESSAQFLEIILKVSESIGICIYWLPEGHLKVSIFLNNDVSDRSSPSLQRIQIMLNYQCAKFKKNSKIF